MKKLLLTIAAVAVSATSAFAGHSDYDVSKSTANSYLQKHSELGMECDTYAKPAKSGWRSKWNVYAECGEGNHIVHDGYLETPQLFGAKWDQNKNTIVFEVNPTVALYIQKKFKSEGPATKTAVKYIKKSPAGSGDNVRDIYVERVSANRWDVQIDFNGLFGHKYSRTADNIRTDELFNLHHKSNWAIFELKDTAKAKAYRANKLWDLPGVNIKDQ